MRRFFLIFLFFSIIISADISHAMSDLAAGFQRLNENNFEEALVFFGQALETENNNLREYALYGIARAEFGISSFESALSDFKKLSSDYKETVLLENSRYYIIQCYLKLGQFEKVLEESDAYLSGFPDGRHAAEVGHTKGEILKLTGNFRQAYKTFNEVDLWYPLSAYGRKARLEMKAMAKKHKLPAYHPSPGKLFAKGESYFDSNDYESAAAIFNRLAREYPKHKLTAKALLMLGRAEMEQGREDSSIKSFERSFKLSYGVSQGKSLYYLGRAHGRRGRYEKAVKYMKKVISTYPGSSYADDALYYLGIYYEKLDSPDAALSTYLKLIANYAESPHLDEAVLKAGHLYYLKEDYENSFKIYGLAKNLPAGADTPQCLFLWGLMAEKLGRREAAAGIYFYLADKFDHTYQSYRAREKLIKLGYATPGEKLSLRNVLASSEIDEAYVEDAMDKWKEKNSHLLNSEDVSKRIARYEKLMEEGLSDFAFLEARQLLVRTGGGIKNSAQIILAKIMQKNGEYATPIRYVEKTVKSAVLAGKAHLLPQDMWKLAYPKGFWEHVSYASGKNGLDPYLTLAVIREESRFNPKALSRSRAHGLMQIIPSTGKILAKQLNIQPFKRSNMYNAETNIEMGTYYLSNLIKRFNGDVALALAGYNGGPVRVKKWVNNWYNKDNLDIDEFIQSIPLRETRYYVQKVLGSYYEYKRIYGGRS